MLQEQTPSLRITEFWEKEEKEQLYAHQKEFRFELGKTFWESIVKHHSKLPKRGYSLFGLMRVYVCVYLTNKITTFHLPKMV